MTFRQRHTAIFRREPVSRSLWQPRLEHWIHVNRRDGTLPPRYRDLDHLAIYDDLNCSPPAYFMFNQCLVAAQTGDVETITEALPDGQRVTWRTPVGEISQTTENRALSWHYAEWPLKTAADFPVLEYLLRQTTWRWDAETFAAQDAVLGDRAAPTLYTPRINVQRLIIQYTGFEGFHYLYHDCPTEMARLLTTLDETDDAIYDVVSQCPVEIINFGDNVAGEFVSPAIFERWYLPHYQKRAAQLRAAGKQCHSHWDGSVKPLLPYIRDSGMDGIEALTPLPQGDVTLQEMRAAMTDDQILVDGIPCTHFMPQHSVKEVVDFAREILDLWGPRVVLGISDEISPPGDIEKVRAVAEFVETYAI